MQAMSGSLTLYWAVACLIAAVLLQGRLQTLPLCESTRDDVIDSISQFLSPRNFAKVCKEPIQIANNWPQT